MNETDASSQSGSSSGSNGGADPVVEPENDQQKYAQAEYKLEDFSQQRINRGQQEINYWINEAHKATLLALNEFRTAIAGTSSDPKWGKLDDAIKEVSKATTEIAGPFPPGCAKPQSEE